MNKQKWSGSKIPQSVIEQAEKIKEKLLIPLIQYEVDEHKVSELIEKFINANGLKINSVDIASVVRLSLQELLKKSEPLVERKTVETYEPHVNTLDIASIIKKIMEKLVKDNAVKIETETIKNYELETDKIKLAEAVRDALKEIVSKGEVRIEPTTKYEVKTEDTVKYVPKEVPYSLEELVKEALEKIISKGSVVVKPKFKEVEIEVFKFTIICPECKHEFHLGGLKK